MFGARCFAAVCLAVCCVPALAAEIYVSPGGSDHNLGTRSKPLATLIGAREAVRTLKQRNQAGPPGVTVWIAAGTYRMNQPLELGDADSGTAQAPIVYRALPGEEVRLSGGAQLPASAFKKVTDPAILERLPAEARNKILQADLRALDILDFGKMQPHGFRRPYVNAPLELFIDDNAMPLARWPNEGKAAIGKIVNPGSIPRNGDYANRGGTFEYDWDRPTRWAKADDIWLSGFFNNGYADDTIKVASIDAAAHTITLAQAHLYGLASGNAWNAVVASNLLEEIDEPGEWFLDRGSGILYLYPPGPLGKSRICVSMLEEPLVTMEGTSHVQFRNLIFECGRGMGVYIERGTSNQIAGCAIRNMGVVGICIGQGIEPDKVYRHETTLAPISRQLGSWHEHLYANSTFNRNAGTNHGIVDCDIYNTGSGGISLGGGDRVSLTPAGNYVQNCHIYRFNRRDRSYKAAVNIDGVGNRVSQCLIHDAPGMAIYLHGNDHVIEFNEIHHACMDASDSGVFYMGRDPSELGNVVRCNWFHDNGADGPGGIHGWHTCVIYLDDCACGTAITGNLFQHNTGLPVFINGGNHNVIDGNLFVGQRSVEVDSSLPPQKWAEWVNAALGITRLRRVLDITRPPYASRYPAMAHAYDSPETVDVANEVTHNLAYRCGSDFGAGLNRVKDNVLTNDDPGFTDVTHNDLRLKDDAAVLQQIPGFHATVQEKMGLAMTADRKTLPLGPPSIFPVDGRALPGESVVLSARSPGAVIRYTTDDQPVTSASDVFSDPLPVLGDVTIRARAFSKDGRAQSEEVRESFVPIIPSNPARCTRDGWLRVTEAVKLQGIIPGPAAVMTHCDNGTWASFGPFDFGQRKFDRCELVAAVDPKLAGGKLHLRVDAPNGPTVGTVVFQHTGGFSIYKPQTMTLTDLHGRHMLYLVFDGKVGIANIARFRFTQGG